MKRNLTLASCLALLFVIVLAVQAQAQGHRFNRAIADPDEISRRGDFLAKALDLTDEQKTAARKLHEEAAERTEPLMEQREQQWKEIHEMLDGDNPDATAIGQRLIAAHAVREQLEAIHEETMAKFSALLNADQVEKLEKLKEVRRERGGFGFHRRGHGD